MTVQEINKEISQNALRYIELNDMKYSSKLREVADIIYENRKQKPIILLSGPSGAGKTTTALMLKSMLIERSAIAHTLSLDNYFISFTKEQVQLALKGKIDLEAPERLDIPFLNEQLIKMINGEKVDLPKYNFKTDQRVSYNTLIRNPEDLVIIEGTHALNQNVVKIPDDKTYRIYIDIAQRVAIDDAAIGSSMIRLIRRMIRDKRYRNRNVNDTFDMFDKVEVGEKKYIAPYKVHSNYNIDTFMAYELSVYKNFLAGDFDLLEQKLGLHVMVKILKSLDALDQSLIPPCSIVREFIGDSSFEY